MTMLDIATRHRRRGWVVIPGHEPTADGCTCELGADCASRGKHPRIRWQGRDAVSEAEVRRWWMRWPMANPMIVTGAPSNLLVLDIDPRHYGYRSLCELERRHGWMPATRTAISGGRGLHLYFRHPGVRIGPSAGKLMRGLDVRCDGSIIVGPGSLHSSGKRYRWAGGDANGRHPVAPPPDWLVPALLPPPPRPAKPLRVNEGFRGSYVEAALESAAQRLRQAAEGEKHDVLWREAYGLGRLVGAGLLEQSTAEAVLFGAVAGRAKSERAALYTIQRKLEQGRANPRPVVS
jgi:hypothetical protein